MSEQLKEKCAICNGYLFSDDDIVYCPECGAPHHRDCYVAVGHCGMQEYHGTEKEYKKSVSNTENANSFTCSDCGKELPEDSKFCPYCGKNYANTNTLNDDEQFISFGPGGIKIDPYGGVDKNSSIDGVKVKDLARFIAFTPNRLIPKFKKFFELGKRVSWNWMGFLSPYCHALFRKMYFTFFSYVLLEITAYVLLTPFYSLILSANLPVNYTSAQLSEYVLNHADEFLNPAALLMAFLGFMLLFGLRIFAGLFNDWLYMRHSVKTIKTIHQDKNVEEEEQLRKKGGVRPFISIFLFMVSMNFSGMLPAIISDLLF